MDSALRLPDFFLVGAMKSGTTSMHEILAEHPAVFMPAGEIGFFDHDDFFEHVDNFISPQGRWQERNFVPTEEELRWYTGLFAQARHGQLVGVDSTTYLSARHAPARIAAARPDARIIVMLRDPVARAYSQYWHMLQVGSMLYSFEESLRLMPERLLSRSFYVESLRRYLQDFPRSQLHVIVFESFIQAPAETAVRTLEFLGIDAAGFQPSRSALHRNAASLPRSALLQQLRNRRRWKKLPAHSVQHPGGPLISPDRPGGSALRNAARSFLQRINSRTDGRAPPMREDTRRFLVALMRRENQGLSELIGMNVDEYWYKS